MTGTLSTKRGLDDSGDYLDDDGRVGTGVHSNGYWKVVASEAVRILETAGQGNRVGCRLEGLPEGSKLDAAVDQDPGDRDDEYSFLGSDSKVGPSCVRWRSPD